LWSKVSNKMKIKKILKKHTTLIIIVAVVVIVSVAYFVTQINFLQLKADKPLKTVKKDTHDFIIDVKTKNFEALKTDYPNVVNSPNISDRDLKVKFIESVKPNQTLNLVSIEPGRLNPTMVKINQGDLVNFVNNSNNSLKVVGDSWGSYIDLAPSESFIQEFDLIGDYEYSIEGINGLSGTITVEP